LAYSWSYSLLPYIEQGNLYNQFNSKFPVHDTANSQNGILAATPQAAFSCPSDTKPQTIALATEAINPAATSSYKAASGAYNAHHVSTQPAQQFNGAFERDSRGAPYKLSTLTDGTSNTILIGETKWGMNTQNRTRSYLYGASDAGSFWADMGTECVLVNGFRAINWPLKNQAGNRTAGSFHASGAQFGFGDGSVHFISESIDHTQSRWFSAAPFMQGSSVPLNTLPFGTYQRLYAVSDGLVISGLDR
jgi:hypothetical protein